MSERTVTTQAELDAAIKAKVAYIYIRSEAGLWLRVTDSGSSHVVARGSSHVVARDSSHVEARGSSHVVARGSSHVVAWDSSHVEARDSSHVEARGSSHVVARDSSHVEAWDSSHVVARGSSHVVARDSSHVEAGRLVAIHKHSTRAVLTGGVIIDVTAVDQTHPATWCDISGVTVADGKAVLYKALNDRYEAGERYTPTIYTPGSSPVAADWRADNECGGGLHLSPTTAQATDYRPDAKRWVACEVDIADLRPILGGTAKAKVPTCRVLHEVDRWGTRMIEVTA